jgi:isopenicillin N synthase-like dioxygenase
MKELLIDNAVQGLKNSGYFIFRPSNRIGDAINDTFEVAYQFFKLPAAEKILDRLPEDFGYRPTGIEYSQSPDRPDPIESFTASIRTRKMLSELRSTSAQILYWRMLEVISLLEPFCELLVLRLAQLLGGDSLVKKLKGALNQWSCLQINYSRPADITVPYLHELHEDGHLITLASVSGPGLEIKSNQGQFISVNPISDEIIIMPGEIAWLLSGGAIRPLYHQVKPVKSCPRRLSLLFFVDIDPRLCTPWILNEVNKNVDIGSKVLSNAERFGLDGFKLDK